MPWAWVHDTELRTWWHTRPPNRQVFLVCLKMRRPLTRLKRPEQARGQEDSGRSANITASISAIPLPCDEGVAPPTPTRRPTRHHRPGAQPRPSAVRVTTTNPLDGLIANKLRSTREICANRAMTNPSESNSPSSVRTTETPVAAHNRVARNTKNNPRPIRNTCTCIAPEVEVKASQSVNKPKPPKAPVAHMRRAGDGVNVANGSLIAPLYCADGLSTSADTRSACLRPRVKLGFGP